MAPLETKLMFLGRMFHFHDCGRKTNSSSTPKNNNNRPKMLGSVLFLEVADCMDILLTFVGKKNKTCTA